MAFNVTMSPHVHSGNSTRKCMAQVIIALLPALCWSFYAFGLGAVYVTLTSVVACVAFEYLITRFIMKQPSTVGDLSAVLTGLLLAFNVPSGLPLWIIVIGALIAIGVAKLTYGGIGQNIFNPALIGRVFLLIAFPADMTDWSAGRFVADAMSGATPLGWIAEGGDLAKLPSAMELLLGQTGGSMGEVSALLLLIGFVYLLVRKTITWHIPVAIFVSAFLMGLCVGFGPELAAEELLELAAEELLMGGMVLGAVYMATDYVTSPMNPWGKIVYGVCIGAITIIIRRFGSYPEGMSFAIIIMNAFTPLINKYFKPTRFGVVKK